MKLVAICPECPTQPEGRVQISSYAEISDRNVLEVKCPRGHLSHTALQQPRFELLFESGALALLDGYTREAVSSFAAAVERFYEYWINVTLVEAGHQPDVVADFWKDVARQSERQLGAFLALYLRERSAPAPTLANKWVDFRNNIIHKGYWPSAAEAESYGNAVLQYIAPLLSELNQKCPQGVDRAMAEQVRLAHRDSAGRYRPSMHIVTILGRAADRPSEIAALDEHLQTLAQHRDLYGR